MAAVPDAQPIALDHNAILLAAQQQIAAIANQHDAVHNGIVCRLFRIGVLFLRFYLLLINTLLLTIGTLILYTIAPNYDQAHHVLAFCMIIMIFGSAGNLSLRGWSKWPGLIVMTCLFASTLMIITAAPSVEYVGSGAMDKALAKAKVSPSGELELESKDFHLVKVMQVTFDDLSRYINEAKCVIQKGNKISCQKESAESAFMIFFDLTDGFVRHTLLDKDIQRCVQIMHKIVTTTDEGAAFYCRFRVTCIHAYPYMKVIFWLMFLSFCMCGILNALFSLEPKIKHLWTTQKADFKHYVVFYLSIFCILFAKVIFSSDLGLDD